MIGKGKVLAVITARGGSKGVPNKNIREVAGRPLLEWTVRAALGAPSLDRVILSSDDARIIAVAKNAGCDVPFVRPASLATDEATTLDALLHAVEEVPGYEYLVTLQPTSPLRTAEDIEGCIAACVAKDAASACSVVEVAKNPYWMFTLGEDQRMRRLLDQNPMPTRRQDLPDVYMPNGAVYVNRIDSLKDGGTLITQETVGYVMSAERSLDIDSEFDLRLCDLLLTHGSM